MQCLIIKKLHLLPILLLFFNITCQISFSLEMDENFNPKELNSTQYYSRVYKGREEYELGTRISFDVPDHVPNPCDECEKRDGNCGVGLRCVCHPKLCRDKVISYGAILKPFDNTISCLILLVIVMKFI